MVTVFSKERLSSPIHKQFEQNAISHIQVYYRSYYNAHAAKRVVRKLKKGLNRKLRTYLEKINLDLEEKPAMLLGC
jgi:hypothetical protein